MEYKRTLGDYKLCHKLGSGEYSKVREAIKDGKRYAIKYIKMTNDLRLSEKYNELLQNEVKIMRELDNPYIVKLYEANNTGVISKENGSKTPVLYLVFELVYGGDLFDYVKKESFSEKLARYYFKQIIQALEYIHNKGYAHRDIKIDNLLMDNDYNLKLADFGLSSTTVGKDGPKLFRTYKGTEGYMAPEIISHLQYSGEKVDLFAAGVLLYIMVAQHPPFRRASICDGLYKLFCYKNELYWKKSTFGKPDDTFSDDFKFIINSLLSKDPNQRMTIDQIKESKWYNGEDMTNEEVKSEIEKRKFKLNIKSEPKNEDVINLETRRDRNID